MPEKFDIYSKIFYMDLEKFVRHLCRLVLRHQMPVWNYFVNSFYSVTHSVGPVITQSVFNFVMASEPNKHTFHLKQVLSVRFVTH